MSHGAIVERYFNWSEYPVFSFDEIRALLIKDVRDSYSIVGSGGEMLTVSNEQGQQRIIDATSLRLGFTDMDFSTGVTNTNEVIVRFRANVEITHLTEISVLKGIELEEHRAIESIADAAKHMPLKTALRSVGVLERDDRIVNHREWIKLMADGEKVSAEFVIPADNFHSYDEFESSTTITNYFKGLNSALHRFNGVALKVVNNKVEVPLSSFMSEVKCKPVTAYNRDICMNLERLHLVTESIDPSGSVRGSRSIPVLDLTRWSEVMLATPDEKRFNVRAHLEMEQ